MKGTEQFKLTIKAYLDKYALKDEAFQKKYSNPEKKIDDCITYILNQVQKTKVNGFTNAEIYGMAMHYYDEEKVDIGKAIDMEVKVNHHVEFSDEEREELIQQAKQKVINDEVARLHKINKDKIEKAKKNAKPEKASDVLPDEVKAKVQAGNDKKFAEQKKADSPQTSLF